MGSKYTCDLGILPLWFFNFFKLTIYLFELLNCIKFSNLALSSTNSLLIVDMMMDLNILSEVFVEQLI